MTQLRGVLWFAVFAVAFALLPARVVAQSARLTDDGFLSSNQTTQQANVNGQGIVLVVAGASAAVGTASVGTIKTFRPGVVGRTGAPGNNAVGPLPPVGSISLPASAGTGGTLLAVPGQGYVLLTW